MNTDSPVSDRIDTAQNLGNSSLAIPFLTEPQMARLRHYVPLLVWALAVVAVLLVPSKIISYGFLPADDALRHAAKAVSGRNWSDIMVMRPGFELDIHSGWHALLSAIYRIGRAHV